MTIPQGAGDQGGAGRDRPAAEAAGRGGQDGADRRDRHGSSWPSSPSRATSSSSTSWPQQIEQYLRDLAEQQGLEQSGPGLPADAQGLSALSRPAAGADLQRPGGLADRPAPGPDRRRRGRRDAADQALRVRRLAGQHGHPRLADQRHDPRRAGPADPLRPEDIEVHRTRNTPKCATAVLLDMSGSMRYDGLYVNVKRMGLALDGLIRREYPGDWLQFIEIVHLRQAAAARRDRHVAAQAGDDLRPGGAAAGRHERRRTSARCRFPPHFTNIQHGLQLARQIAGRPGHAQPADHPDHRRPADGPFRRARSCTCSIRPTRGPKQATMREGRLCQREGITINIFLLPQLVAVARRRAVRLPPGRIDRRAACSSPPAGTSTATWSGTICGGGGKSWPECSSNAWFT